MILERLKLQNLKGEHQKLLNYLSSGKKTTAFGLSFGEKCHIAANLPNALNVSVLYVLPDAIAAAKAFEECLQLGAKAALLKAREEMLLYSVAQSNESLYERLKAFGDAITGKADLIITTPDALIQKAPEPEWFYNLLLRFKTGKEYKLENIIKSLIVSGYKRENLINARAQFALRGDILDIYPINCEVPVRMEFFGDELESIKYFSLENYKTNKAVQEISVYPATDVFYENAEDIITALSAYKGRQEKTDNIIDECIVRLENEDRSPSMCWILPFTNAVCSSKYFGDWLTVFDEPKLIRDKFSVLEKEHANRLNNLIKEGGATKEHKNQYCDSEKLIEDLLDGKTLSFQKIMMANNLFEAQETVEFRCSPVKKYRTNIPELIADLKNWSHFGYTVILCAGNAASARAVYNSLLEQDASIDFCDKNLSGDFEGRIITPFKLNSGFFYHGAKLVVLGEEDFLIKQKKTVKLRSNKTDVFTTPEIGDYVVHEVHGIGRCEGVTQLDIAGKKDFVVVSYKDGDKLYVPVDQMDLLKRYSGSEAKPHLSKIGGKDFEKVKARVKKSITDIAGELIELYSKREKAKGKIYPADGYLQSEFEKAFPYNETEDQLKAIADVKNDMEHGKLMDRLICGDVGYGKTEVALRAAFKTISEGGQVAFLAPTTILCEQHYNNCKIRFNDFGIKIASLSRFKSAAEQKEVIKKCEEGKIDLLCGTHRMLSKDVHFKNLELIILDEEQRFGVEHKERLKTLKENVNVLTLTATPIPRTLNMSMTGIRDISIIDTPPMERIPVQTYVTEFSETLVRDAVLRETARGGQTFLLFNRVEFIDNFAAKMRALLPEVRITVAHGKMPEHIMESSINAFYNGEYDLLICTTIIENGIDLKNANTLIVCDADKLGLAQLYQLRGRVGRSDRLAYAYFTYPENKVLTEDAYKRLAALTEYTEFGSGFKIAMRDLEIRGAGNILGKEQSGHMAAVGYDMYCRLLKETVSELKGEKPEGGRITVETDIEGYVPENYISDSEGRIKLYQRIAVLTDIKQRDLLIDELKDIYGNVPNVVLPLMNISILKNMALKIGAEQLILNKQKAKIVLRDAKYLNNDALLEALNKFSQRFVLANENKIVIVVNTSGLTPNGILDEIYKFLQYVNFKNH